MGVASRVEHPVGSRANDDHEGGLPPELPRRAIRLLRTRATWYWTVSSAAAPRRSRPSASAGTTSCLQGTGIRDPSSTIRNCNK